MINLRVGRRMVHRRRTVPTWGWDFRKPIEVHGFDVEFTHLGLRLVLLGKDGPVEDVLLPFGEAPAVEPWSGT